MHHNTHSWEWEEMLSGEHHFHDHGDQGLLCYQGTDILGGTPGDLLQQTLLSCHSLI